ncbi:phage holin family protein [Clavibacter michiganensis]|uniref:phage holin family protein n=1 Tax=Clavibacter michiganensis TaxID=28447 RepID=UPI000CE7877A|nr:phage holin family protein [Clavibacter michiganensis]PPF89875.1 phage holin family protein [Clavibacter michiganensis]PPF97880.1 phage holin family protein [Clavibacter michiganensis]
MTDQDLNPKSKRSLVRLVADLPTLIVQLIKDEIESFKNELVSKLKHAGIGAGFLVVALFFAFIAFLVLVAAAILGLSEAFSPWLSALIVAGVFLLVTVVLALLGIRWIKKGVPPTPEETVDSLKEDVDAVKGTGKYDH